MNAQIAAQQSHPLPQGGAGPDASLPGPAASQPEYAEWIKVKEPVRQPVRHGLLMGLAAAASVALILCCLLSVTGRLAPGRKYTNRGIVAVSVISGIYVGIRSWRNSKVSRPPSRGRCPDCGREALAGEKQCSRCGRSAEAIASSPFNPSAKQI